LRFLAGGSAWTDGSFIGRAGRGLVLSRRNERGAEERRNDKNWDCKFGSHKEGLPEVTVWSESFGRRLSCEAGNFVKIWFSKKIVSWLLHRRPVLFQTFVTFRTRDLRKARPMVQLPIGNTQVFANVIKSPRCPKCGEMMALRLIEPERPGFDLRTFECPKCFGTQTSVASISCEVIRGDRGPVGWCTPELLRIRGRRLLRSGKKNPSAAEALLMRSLDAARQQEALSWERAQLWALPNYGKLKAAAPPLWTCLLQGDRFTEGFATTDLVRSDFQLGELRSSAWSPLAPGK
jgi:hypothetical protein